MSNELFLIALLASVTVSVGLCIVLHRPDYAQPITKTETVLVVFLWWIILVAMQIGRYRRKEGWWQK